MKQRFISLIALFLLVCTVFTFVSCSGDTTTPSDNGDGSVTPPTSDGNDPATPGGAESTEDALFEELRKAHEATLAYNGAFTVAVSQISETKQGDRNQSSSATANVSVDVNGSKYYESTTIKYSDTSYKSIQKIFSEGSAAYMYQNHQSFKPATTPVESDEIYTKLNSANDVLTEQSNGLTKVLENFVRGLFLAESYAEITSSFSEAYDQIKNNEINIMKEDGRLEANGTLSLSPLVTIGKDAATGETVLTITSRLNVPKMMEDDDTMENYEIVMVRKIGCKNGKISSVLTNISSSCKLSRVTEEGTEVIDTSTASSNGYNFTYTFDQAGYDAIAVDLPDDPSKIKEEDSHDTNRITVHLGEDVSHKVYDIPNEGNMEAILMFVKSDVESYYSLGFDINEYSSGITVKNLYKDAAHTQKIDPATITRNELLALEEIYADYEVTEGVAIIQEVYEEKQELSKKFLITSFAIISGDSGYQDSLVQPAGETYEFDLEADPGIERRVYVNGTLVTDKTLTVESGKTYVIKYVDVTTDNSLGLSHILQV